MRDSEKGGCGCGGSPKQSRQIVVPEDAYMDIPMPDNPPVAGGRQSTAAPHVREAARQQAGVWYLNGPGMPIPGA